ncbi:hypothetical protein Tco_0502947 [Tanacetum coccineum]
MYKIANTTPPHPTYTSPPHEIQSTPPEAQTTPQASLPHTTNIPSHTPTPRKMTKRAIRISQSKALSPVADETAPPTRGDRYGEAFPTATSLDAGHDMENIRKTFAMPYESFPRVTSLGGDEGDAEKDSSRSIDKGSESTGDLANVLSSMGAINILASGGGSVGNVVSKPMIKFVKETGYPSVSKVNNTKKFRKPTVKYAEMYRSQRPRRNQRNWNNQKSQQLGSDFVMIKKACYVWKPKNRVIDQVPPVSSNVSNAIVTASEKDPTAEVLTTARDTTPYTRRPRASREVVIRSTSPIPISLPSAGKEDKRKGKEIMIEPEKPAKAKFSEYYSFSCQAPKVYPYFESMLKDFDRDDLVMFEPVAIDLLWQFEAPIKSWKMYKSCKVHCLSIEGMIIYMLDDVEYPFQKTTLKKMLDHKCEVDSTAFPLSVSLKSQILSKDPPPKLSRYDTEACEFLRTHTALFRRFLEPFLCIIRYYMLDENSYPTFWDGDEGGDGLITFIRQSDPTKVRVRKRNLADRELKLLKMTEGRTVALDPPATAASGGSGDIIDQLFDEGDNAGQEHSAKKDDNVQEEVIAKDASEVVAEKPQKKRKRKVIGDASGSILPPKKLRDDYQSLPPSTGGKSLSALCVMISEGYAIPTNATESLVTASVILVPDVGPVDSVSGLNLRTRPPHVRYVVFFDSSHHSSSYSEAASLVRSAADVPVVTVSVTTIVDANVVAGSKAKDAPKDFEHIGDSASACGVDADAAIISKLKKPSISSDSFYASKSLDTETMHRVYVPRWKLRAMDYGQLYSEFNVEAARRLCLRTEVRMLAEHTLERKGALEDRCVEQTTLLSEKDMEIAHLRPLLSLKEAEAVEAISLRKKDVLSERVEALESVAASKEVELASLSSQVANLTVDLSGFQLSRNELNSKKSLLESALVLFKEQVEKMQAEQMRVLSERVAAIDSDLMEMVLHMDAEFYPRYLTTIAGRRSCHRQRYAGVSFSLLAQLEANKDANMAEIMDLLRLEGPAAKTSEASQLQPWLDQLMIPIHRLEDQVIIGETSLAFSLEVAHNRVQRLRGDATARRLSLTDSILPLIEPLSARNLTGEASSSATFTTAVTTALSTTFVQTYPVSATLFVEVPPSPKVVFKEEELDTTPEHVPAP